MKNRRNTSGATLVEVMLAGSIILILVLSLFEGLSVAVRIARENRSKLEADSYAFDRLWLELNKEFPTKSQIGTETDIDSEFVPALHRKGWITPRECVNVILVNDGTEATNTIKILYGKSSDPKCVTRSVVRGNVPRAASNM